MRTIAILLIFVLVAIPAASYLIAQLYYLPLLKAPHVRLQKMAPEILKDLIALEAFPIFPETQYQSDAQSYLAKYVSWEGSKDSIADADRVRELLTKYVYWKTAPGQLKELLNDPEFKALDTRWFEQLHQFDHWNLSTRPEVREGLLKSVGRNGIARIGIFAGLPIPNYAELRQWATLYVLQKYAAGKTAQALPVVRKAAQLSHSSGTLVGHMTAVLMLKDEYTFMAVLKASGFQPVPETLIAAYQRLSWAWVGLAREPWYGELPEEFKPYIGSRFGACTAVWEFGSGPLGYQEFLEPRALFEMDFTANFKRTRVFQEQLLKVCNLHQFREAWIRGGEPIHLGRVPYLRRILGLGLMSLALPDSLHLYARPPK
jgi:hypothetical protein